MPKPILTPRTFIRKNRRSILGASVATLIASLVLASSNQVLAAPAAWNATPTDGNWVATGPENNWSTGTATFPGATSGTTNTDTATFSGPSSQTNITINNASLNIGSITFSGGATAYTIGATGSNSLLLTSGGTIQTTGTSNIETVNAPLVIEGAGGTYTFSSNATSATNALNIGGAISGGAAGATVLTLNGSNTGNNTISGVIADGSATTLAVTKEGAGTWTLTGANIFTGGTTVNAGTLQLGNGVNPASLQGAEGSANLSGAGGAGTTAVAVNNAANLTVLSQATITGGAGGSGSTIGGAGGTGVIFNSTGTLTNGGSINGGNGGMAASVYPLGAGGTGVSVTSGGSLINTGSINGGTGDNPGFPGGPGVYFSNGGSLTNSGVIIGGQMPPFTGPVQPNLLLEPAPAVIFSGAAGTLVNSNGGGIEGVVMGNYANSVTLETGSSIGWGLDIGTSTAATLTLTGSGTQTYSTAVFGPTTFNGSVIKSGTGTWILDETLSYGGGTTVNAGTLQLGDGLQPVSLQGAAGSANLSGAGGAGTTAVTVNNAANLTVMAQATITGGAGGSGSTAPGAGGAGVIFNSSGTLTNGGSIYGGAAGGAGVGVTNGGSLINTGLISGGAPSSLTNGVGAYFSNGGSLTNSGTISSGSFQRFSADSAEPAGYILASPAVTFTGAAGTLINKSGGDIIGDVVMGNYANSVTLETGSIIEGFLDMGTSTASTLTLTGSGTQAFGLAVTSPFPTFNGPLIKNGTSTWILDEFLNFGSLTINAGTIGFGDSAVFPNAVSPAIANDSSFGTGNITIGSGGGNVYAAGSALTLSNPFILNGALTVVNDPNDAQDLTLAGVISGAGGLTLNGTGALILAAQNTYGGGTTINAGTLLVTNTTGSGTGTGPVTVNAGGTLGGSGTITGPVTLNSGGTIAPGATAPGTTLHAASLTWNGGGALNLQLGAASDQLALSGALTKSTATIGAYSLNIINSGGLGNQSVYTLATFASTNFAAGDFSLTLPGGYSGILEETPTSLDLAVSSGANTVTGATLIGLNGLQFYVSGNFFSEGTIIGNATLTGGGELYIDGTLIGNLQVLQGTLGGNGSISGNLFNAGTVSPGHSPGTLQVSGNYTQSSTGVLRIEIGGLGAGQFDLLHIGGKATLGGTLQLVQLNNFNLQRGEKITFLTAAQGIDGNFTSVINSFVNGTIFSPTLVYGLNSLELEEVQGSFEAFARNSRLAPNDVSIGRALDSAVSDSRAAALINYLDGRQLGDLPGDFEKINPEQLTSIFTIGVSLAEVQSLNLQRRAEDIRSGSSGFSAERFAMNGPSPAYSGAFDIGSGAAGPAGPDGKESKTVAPAAPVDQRWGAFLSGTGDWVNVGDTGNARGYNIESGGFTLGVDYKVCEHFTVGMSFGYTGSTADLTDRGRIFVDGGKAGIYATTYSGGWYIDTAVNGGYNSYDTRRSALQGQASGSTDGGELDALVGAGYDFKKGALSFGPTATFNYTYLGLDGFSEHGSLAPLDIHGSDEESLRTALGFKVNYEWKVGKVLIKPELRVAWQHEFGDTTYAIDSSFASGAGGVFTVDGPKIGRDSALLSAGFAIQCTERSSLFVYYDGVLGCANYNSSSVSGGLRIDF